MAAGEIQLINLALTELGQSTITSLSQATESARAAAAVFESVRDQCLHRHWWNCAMKRASLNLLADAPAFGFSHAYQLPSDFIRVKSINDCPTAYAVEADQILTDASEVNLRYVFRLTDVGKMSQGLQQVLVYALAAAMAKRLTGSETIKRQFEELVEERLANAQQVDSAEHAVESLEPIGWLSARHGGSYEDLPIDVTP